MPHGFDVTNASRLDAPPLFVSKAAAARRLGVSLHTLRQLITAGEIDVYFNGRREMVITASVDRFRDRITRERAP
jgi:excisionase family DNA binding protein